MSGNLLLVQFNPFPTFGVLKKNLAIIYSSSICCCTCIETRLMKIVEELRDVFMKINGQGWKILATIPLYDILRAGKRLVEDLLNRKYVYIIIHLNGRTLHHALKFQEEYFPEVLLKSAL